MTMVNATSSSSMTDRMMRAARLDVSTYEEVEADTSATSQALTVVVLASVASGIAGAIGAILVGNNPVGGLFMGLFLGLFGWAAWSFVIYFVGTRLFGGTATYGELLRTLGFANSPGVLNILGFIPVLGGIIALLVWFWTLATGFVAVRQALDLDNGRAIAAIIVGIVAYLIVFWILITMLAVVGMGSAMMGI